MYPILKIFGLNVKNKSRNTNINIFKYSNKILDSKTSIVNVFKDYFQSIYNNLVSKYDLYVEPNQKHSKIINILTIDSIALLTKSQKCY